MQITPNSNSINLYIQELTSQNVDNRQAATLDLMAIGKDAQSAVPALIQAPALHQPKFRYR